MDENLMIGAELLDYMATLQGVAEELRTAQGSVTEMKTLWEETDTYEGEAADPVAAYVTQLDSHLERLVIFYEKAALYAYTTYETMYESDVVMAAFLLSESKGSR